MKPTLVWCVWYRVMAEGGPWDLLYVLKDYLQAEYMRDSAEVGRKDTIEFRITRHEVEVPR